MTADALNRCSLRLHAVPEYGSLHRYHRSSLEPDFSATPMSLLEKSTILGSNKKEPELEAETRGRAHRGPKGDLDGSVGERTGGPRRAVREQVRA